MLKKTLPTVFLSLALFSGHSSAKTLHPEEQARAISNQAMKCMTVYELLGANEDSDEFAQHILQSQSIFMSTVYLFTAPGETDEEVTERFLMSFDFTRRALIQQHPESPDFIPALLYQCEGWREDMVRRMAERKDVLEDLVTFHDHRYFYSRMPLPRDDYQLEGATLNEIRNFVNNAMKQYY